MRQATNLYPTAPPRARSALRCGALAAGLLAAGCSLVSDLDGLSGGPEAGAGGGQGGSLGPGGQGGAGGAGAGGRAGAGPAGESGAGGMGGGAGGGADEGAYFDAIAADGPAAHYSFEDMSDGETTPSRVPAAGLTCGNETRSDMRCLDGACCPALAEGGLFGKGARFDGTGNRLFAPTADAFSFFNTGDFTVEMWVKIDFTWAPPDKRLRLVNKDQGSDMAQRGSVFGYKPASADNAANVSFTRYDGAETFRLQWGNAATLSPESFTHVAVAYEAAASKVVLYVDGLSVVASESGSPSSVLDSTTPLTVGNSYAGDNGFKGTLDELVIYPKALPPERIFAHYELVRGPRGALR